MSDTAQEGYFALAKQTAQGTVNTATTNGYRITSSDLGSVSDNLEADAEIGGGRDLDTAGVAFGSVHVEGSIEAYCRYDLVGHFLLALGFVESGAPVQDATTGAWTHTFVPGTAFTWYTVETNWGRNRAIRRYVDSILNSLELTVSGDEWVTMTQEWLALTELWQASPSVPTYASPDPIGTYLGSKVTLDSLGTFRLSEMTVNIANNFTNDEAVIGQRSLVDLTPKRRDVMFSGTLKINPSVPAAITDLYRAALWGSKTATAVSDVAEPYHTSATVTFGSPKLVGTSTTVRYGIEVGLPDVVLSAFPLEGAGDDVTEAAIEGRAVKGAAPVSTIKVFNARATAY
jgi:hypothetical protein